ncbi:hypothetical protein AB8880_12005 [Alphaproteobacteria bacterium LSUCC0684]
MTETVSSEARHRSAFTGIAPSPALGFKTSVRFMPLVLLPVKKEPGSLAFLFFSICVSDDVGWGRYEQAVSTISMTVIKILLNKERVFIGSASMFPYAHWLYLMSFLPLI